MKTKIPTPSAISDANNTPPAAKSLIYLIFSFLSVEYKSHSFSMHVFKISVTTTSPIQRSIASHS